MDRRSPPALGRVVRDPRVRAAEVVGSNPASPTTKLQVNRGVFSTGKRPTVSRPLADHIRVESSRMSRARPRVAHCHVVSSGVGWRRAGPTTQRESAERRLESTGTMTHCGKYSPVIPALAEHLTDCGRVEASIGDNESITRARGVGRSQAADRLDTRLASGALSGDAQGFAVAAVNGACRG
jgi:hypothetical protein